MRMRSLLRLTSGMLHFLMSLFTHSGSPSYRRLLKDDSNESFNTDSLSRCCAAFHESPSVHRLSSYRGLFAKHVPPLLCLFLTALIVTLQSTSWIASPLLTAFLLVLFFICLVFNIEAFFTFAPHVPSHSRFYSELPKVNEFPVWLLVRLKSPSIESETKSYFILQEDPAKRTAAPTIMFLHGNAGNIGNRLPIAKLLYDVCEANVFLLEYRGFGCSTGYLDECGLYDDAAVAFNYLASGAEGLINGENIFIFGRSLGGAVAVDLGTRPGIATRVRGVIVENTFTSIVDMGRIIFLKMMGPCGRILLPGSMIVNRFESLKKLENRQYDGTTKFLFISGCADDLVPPEMMSQLAHAWATRTGRSGNSKSSWLFENPEEFLAQGTEGMVKFADGNHGTTWMCNGFNDVVKRFISLHKYPSNASKSDSAH